jgi:hypothetical protein
VQSEQRGLAPRVAVQGLPEERARRRIAAGPALPLALGFEVDRREFSERLRLVVERRLQRLHHQHRSTLQTAEPPRRAGSGETIAPIVALERAQTRQKLRGSRTLSALEEKLSSRPAQAREGDQVESGLLDRLEQVVQPVRVGVLDPQLQVRPEGQQEVGVAGPGGGIGPFQIPPCRFGSAGHLLHVRQMGGRPPVLRILREQVEQLVPSLVPLPATDEEADLVAELREQLLQLLVDLLAGLDRHERDGREQGEGQEEAGNRSESTGNRSESTGNRSESKGRGHCSGHTDRGTQA